MVLGEAVKRLRLSLGLTQREVCKNANLTQGFYSAIENGAPVSLETLMNLAAVFNIPVFVLLFMATEKREVLKNQRVWYNRIKAEVDALMEEAISIKNDNK